MNAHDTASTDAPAVLELGADLSPALRALERAYRLIQKRYPDAPDVTIIVKRDERAWGHTTVAKVWAPAGVEDADRFEIMISGENLRRGAVEVAGTLLHEAAHARNLSRGVLDTDVNGRHNKSFATTAEEHGLTVATNGWHGFAATSLEASGQAQWRQLVKVIATGLAKSASTARPAVDHLPPAPPTATPPSVGVSGPAPVGPRKRGNRNLLKAVCGCGHSIRVSRGVLETAVPTCQVCEEPFATA